jgi:hypothetical protein
MRNDQTICLLLPRDHSPIMISARTPLAMECLCVFLTLPVKSRRGGDDMFA